MCETLNDVGAADVGSAGVAGCVFCTVLFLRWRIDRGLELKWFCFQLRSLDRIILIHGMTMLEDILGSERNHMGMAERTCMFAHECRVLTMSENGVM
jgi:hypothetical protein